MSKKFIGNIRLLRKELVSLSIQKLADKPADVILHATLTFNMNDNGAGTEFQKDDEMRINMLLDLDIRGPAQPKGESTRSLFRCNADIEMQVVFQKKMTFETSVTADYPEELLSLVYDDFRLIVEANMGRTAYRDFGLPVDFRSAVQL